MLQYRTIDQETLGLLKKLMAEPYLKRFFLVGGTALALHLGHRISIDINLFSLEDFDQNDIATKLENNFKISELVKNPGTLNLSFQCPGDSPRFIKVDMIKYPYPLIKPVFNYDGIRLLSIEDIIPMKLSAIGGRGSKKDFYDLYFLLKQYSFRQMFSFFDKKFTNVNKLHFYKSIVYFADAESDPEPKTFEHTDWNEIKKSLKKKLDEYLKSL